MIDPNIYGFQIQRGTRWYPGLSEDKIVEYENVLGVRFPDDFKIFLRVMNGTDLPILNIYGYQHEPNTSVAVYSYPRDIDLVKNLIEEVREDRVAITNVMMHQRFDLPAESNLVPIFGHRYLICSSDPSQSVVLSIVGEDAIVYGPSLREYLEREFLLES